MFKSFQNNSRQPLFKGFVNRDYTNSYAYGFDSCRLWYDAAVGTNTTTDLAAISSWQDRIGNLSATQSTAGNQPRYNASNASFNNLPCIEFYSSARFLATASVMPSSSATVAFVAKYDALAPQGNVLLINPSNLVKYVMMGGNGTGVTGIGIYDSTTPILVSTVEDTNAHIVVYTPNRLIIDGVQVATNSTGVSSIGYNQISINDANYFLNGRVAEILMYSSNFSQDQCILLSNNLNSKYALY
jgi:hypothetical protein